MIDLPMLAIIMCCYREGLAEEVYLDSLRVPTYGVGHALTEEERKKYKVGDKVPMTLIAKTYQEDLVKAYQAAKKQAAMLAIDSPDFIAALTSVCFQLGSNWYLEHKKTWSYLMNHKYDEAIQEVKNSRWYRQTPKRVQDFQAAIHTLQ
jgi:hypothetical protein